METSITAPATAIFYQSNKENIPPFVCNNTKKGKNPIPHVAPSSENNKVPKRIPLADISHLYSNFPNATFTIAQEQRSVVSALHSASISRRKIPAVPNSKTLRMGFR